MLWNGSGIYMCEPIAAISSCLPRLTSQGTGTVRRYRQSTTLSINQRVRNWLISSITAQTPNPNSCKSLFGLRPE